MSTRACIVIALALLAGCSRDASPPTTPWPQTAEQALPGYQVETAHFTILSTADRSLTTQVGSTMEELLVAYSALLEVDPGKERPAAKMRLRLYADRNEFKSQNRSRSWAEGYYYQGVCHAYLDANSANPHHWMVHEAVHQLNREFTGYAKEKWINEGLATYLGSSQFIKGKLISGLPDTNAYPLWWLSKWELSGNLDEDIQAERVIALRALITGEGGPSMDDHFNAYYIAYWSITHFMFHYEQGEYAKGYRHLVKHGGSLEDFEKHIGPIDRIEREWYAYLQTLLKNPGSQTGKEG